jgi:hypothetical protein
MAGDDCDDADDSAYPGATEIMDSPVDENCDGYAAVTCEGDFNDVDAEGCGIVTGELSVRFTDWTDMSLLVALEEVELLEILENNSLLELDDLAGLQTAGTIMIIANDVLHDVNGLNGLTSIDQLEINGNDALVSIDLFNEGSEVTEMDSLEITATNITELNAFNAITTIHSQLRIAFNHSITDISGLQNLETIDNVEPGCDSFEPGCYEPDFVIQNHNALTDVSGFSNLERVQTTLRIQDNPALTDISGFAALTQVDDYVYINSNNDLTDISGFDVLDTVGRYVSIDNNDALIDIAGFNALETGGVWIQREDLLEDVSGFASLTTISSDGLLIQYNPALLSFAGLANVTSAVGQIAIVDNNVLEDLDGLAGVNSVSSTQVRLNDSLCQSIVDDYVDGISYDTLGTVTGNLDGC